MALTERALRERAGERVFARGEEYVRHVHGLTTGKSHASGSVQAKRVYVVDLRWPDVPDGTCTCPHAADGTFCKHQVAVGLAVLDAGSTAGPSSDAVGTYLSTLDAPALRDLVRELAARDPAAARLLEVRASARAGGPPDPATTKELTSAVSSAFGVRGFVDYRRSFDVAERANALLDELETNLDGGAPDTVRPALQRALARLRAIGLQADDSAGVIGDAGQRAADLHARACRDGDPDGRALARWLVRFRVESPGWPRTVLADHLDGLGADGLDVYRTAVADADADHPGDGFDRFEIDRMALELADLDGDVDRAIEILCRGQHRAYGAVIDRLTTAGRDAEVLTWTERAVTDGRVSSRLGGQGRSHWLDPVEVAERFVGAERPDDALDVLRRDFHSMAGWAAYERLLGLADRLGVRGSERASALDHARRRATSYEEGALLVELALGEGDLAAAWTAATEFGPGRRWRELADASRETMPREAADLHRAHVDDDLKLADTRRYPGIADALVDIRALYRRAGMDDDFAAYMAGVRAAYGRRPSLMTALDRKGL